MITMVGSKDIFSGAPLPSANSTQELARWLPHGVRRSLMHMDRLDDLTALPASVVAWMDENQMVRTAKHGRNAGKPVLNDTGRKVWSHIRLRLEGKEN